MPLSPVQVSQSNFSANNLIGFKFDKKVPLLVFTVFSVNGNYSEWSDWSKCSTPCGNGVMVRSRTCHNPAPSFGGQDCISLGPKTEQQNCIAEACPGRLVWSQMLS